MIEHTETEWLTIPDVAAMLDISASRVRRLLEERQLLAVRREGVLAIPAVFFRDGEPLKELRGTLTVLADAGFSDEEAMEWLLDEQDELSGPPITALRDGRKSEVRRVAQALG